MLSTSVQRLCIFEFNFLMLQKDYILKLIEEAGKFIALALNLMRKGDYEEAADKIQQAYTGLLKTDRQTWLTGDSDDLHNWLTSLEADKQKIAGDLFYADALVFKELDQIEHSKHFVQLALKCFDGYEQATMTFDIQIERKKKQLLNLLKEFDGETGTE